MAQCLAAMADMENKFKVLITGATGRSGGAAIADLLKMGISVRALVHGIDERSEKLSAKGVEVVAGDLLNFEDISGAMQDIDTTYFCFPILIPGILKATSYFVQAARGAGVKAIVNMSQVSARREAKSHAAQDHWVAEQMIDMSGIPVTHLRPTFFADWFLYVRDGIRGYDTIALPFGNGHWAPIDSEDLGHVVSTITAAPKRYEGRTIKLYGAEEYNIFEMADILSDVMGRKIKYDPVSIERFKELDTQRGDNIHFMQHVTHVAQDCIDGVFAGTNDCVEMITGQKPVRLKDFFIKKRALFE
jgi:NAD(P)H dehydrogenase (quinone)